MFTTKKGTLKGKRKLHEHAKEWGDSSTAGAKWVPWGGNRLRDGTNEGKE